MDFTSEDLGNALLCLAGLACAILIAAAFIAPAIANRKAGQSWHRKRRRKKEPSAPPSD